MQAAQPRGPLHGEYRPITISLMASVALVSYNNLSVTAALPDIGDDLGSVGLLPWIITAELLAAAIAILAIGPLIDSFGVQRIWRLAMVSFVASMVLAALATSMEMLVGFRLLQGFTSGGVIAAAVAAIGLAYHPDVRPKVYAATSAVWGVMGVGGPAIAAVLISGFGWRSIFWFAVPIGVTATSIGWRRLPGEQATAQHESFDRAGLAIMSVVTVALLLAASEPSILTLVWLVIGIVGIGGYVLHSRRVENPVVRLSHLTGRRWRYIHVTSTLAVAGGTGSSSFLPLYLKGARGVSQSGAAFSVLFLVIGWSCAAWISSRLQERIHAAHVVLGGITLLVAATSLAAALTVTIAPLFMLLPSFFFIGGGIGAVTTAGLSLLQGRAGAGEMGRVSSAHQFLRSLGFAYGAAIGGLVLFFVVDQRIGDVEAIRDLLGSEEVVISAATVDALQAGYGWALVVTAAIAAVSLASAFKLVAAIGSEHDTRPDEGAES